MTMATNYIIAEFRAWNRQVFDKVKKKFKFKKSEVFTLF